MEKKCLLYEIKMMREMNHPRVLRLYELYEGKSFKLLKFKVISHIICIFEHLFKDNFCLGLYMVCLVADI